ncbi:MAG: Glycerol-3-phosphate dehydrogenase [Verrucomicrobiales bacterium]|nr:Glycerol-3-phosphate dehydrogenase [Verrucomicrobiales bacterium]
MKVVVVGAGAWGTALANLLCQNKNDVTLWGHTPAHIAELQRTKRNERYLPGIDLCGSLKFQTDLATAVLGAECAIIAVPSKGLRAVTAQLGDFTGIAVSVTKGIEFDTGLTMSGVLSQTMPRATACALSGPTLAAEVAKNIPAAIVAANADDQIARTIQTLFLAPNLRVYTSNDLLGVELGGALKNIIAIAAGISDGQGFGDNTKAGLITRAIVEIRRLGVARGASAETFNGLSGLGDLIVTCCSKLSRNRGFGERVGRGEKVPDILASSVSIAEGYPTARSAYKLARQLNIETPIIDETYAMLYEGKNLKQALHDLMSRDLKPEDSI